MPIPVTCPGCSAKMKAPDGAAGKKVKCPKCGDSITVPAPEPLDDFEVVEEEPAKKPAPAAVARPKAKAVAESDEDDEDEKPKKKPAKAVVEDDDADEKPKRRAKAAADDEEDDEKPKKKKKKKKSEEDDEKGVSMTRNIISGVILLVLLGVAGFVYWNKLGKKDEATASSSSGSSSSGDPPAGPPGPPRPVGGPGGPVGGPGANNPGGKVDLQAGIGLPPGVVPVEEDVVIESVSEVNAFETAPQWYMMVRQDGPDGKLRFSARVFLRPEQHSKIANLWPDQQIKIRGQRTAAKSVVLGIAIYDFYASEVLSSGPQPKFVEMTVDQLLKEFRDNPEAAKKRWSTGFGGDGSEPSWIKLTGTFDGPGPDVSVVPNIQLKGNDANAAKPNRVLIDAPGKLDAFVKPLKLGQIITVRVRSLHSEAGGQVRFITGVFPLPK